MTTQNVSLAFSKNNVGLKQSGANKSLGEKGVFDGLIGNKSNSVNNKNIKYTSDTKSNGKVNVINNGSSQVIKDGMPESKDIENINVYMEDGKLKVQLLGCVEADTNTDVDIDSVLDELKSMIADILGVSEDEIEEVLEQNGMTMMDMLDIQNLQKMFLELKGFDDSAAILTDAGANELWMQLSDMLDDFGICLQDDIFVDANQLASIINSAMNDNNALVDEDTNKLNGDAMQNGSGFEEPDVIIDSSLAGEELSGEGDSDNQGSGIVGGQDESGIVKDAADGIRGESLFSQFMDKVEASVNSDTSQVLDNLHQMREIAGQVIEAVRINVRPDTTGFEIQLNPEHLGKVNVSIQMKDGVAVASFAVRDEMARIALENQIQTLKDTFENQGLKVEAVEVTVSDFSFRQSDNSWNDENQGKEGNRRRFRSDEELETNGNFALGSEESDMDTLEEGSINIRA